jgi:ribosomal-protein-serine acetyltransferase
MSLVVRRVLGRAGFRFEIRPYEVAFATGVYEATDESRKSIAPWMGWLHPGYDLQHAVNWTAQAIRAWDEGSAFEFVIWDTKDGSVAGSCGVNQIDERDKVGNVGYWVRDAKTRLGAATQAVALLEEFGLRELGLNRLEIVVAEGNDLSRKVAEKAGAIYEGLQRRRMCVGERVYDAHMYALVGPACLGEAVVLGSTGDA